MRIYSEERVETLQTLKLLKDWKGEGLLTEQQSQKLHDETTTDLRTTNVFLRVVLFFFTMLIVCGSTALFFSIAFENASERVLFLPLLLLAGASYAGAEFAVREYRLYHFGIEEALVVCSIGFLCTALWARYRVDLTAHSAPVEALFLLICAAASLWTWHRFGYWYTFVAAIAFTAFLPFCVPHSEPWDRALIAALYAVGLSGILAVASRNRVASLRTTYSAAEAFLWTGIYLSMNLVLTGMAPAWMHETPPTKSAFPQTFYWLTWLLIWILPAIVLLRGIRDKHRILVRLGACLAIVTFISNKPYLGWTRHPWDPMLLGVLLAGGAWFMQRWLAGGEDGVRHGFTAARLAGAHSDWMAAGSAFSLLVPHGLGHGPQNGPPTGAPTQPAGEGGASGGGGAGGTF